MGLVLNHSFPSPFLCLRAGAMFGLYMFLLAILTLPNAHSSSATATAKANANATSESHSQNENSNLSSNIYIYDLSLFDKIYEKYNIIHYDPNISKEWYTTIRYELCKHSADAIFIDDIKRGVIKNITTPNEDTIFVVPLKMSLLATILKMGGKSSSSEDGDLKNTLKEGIKSYIMNVLKSFPYYNEHKANHFIMRDSWMTNRLSPYLYKSGIVGGRFENITRESIAIGYSTVKATAVRLGYDFCGYLDQEPMGLDRPYRFSYIVRFDTRPAYADRTLFLRRYFSKKDSASFGSDFPHFIHAYKSDDESTFLPMSKSYGYLQKSLFTISIHGDSPTTDRIFNAMDSETIVLALEKDREGLLRTLPYPDVVDWGSFFVWIPDKKWRRNPVWAVTTACSISDKEILRRQALIVEIRNQVSFWSKPEQMYENMWQAAKKLMRRIDTQKKSGKWHELVKAAEAEDEEHRKKEAEEEEA